MKNKIKKIISKIIKINISELNENLKIKDFKNFDSLATVKIILQIKKELNLKVEFGDFEQNKKIDFILEKLITKN